jgi:hypothetical protein
MLVRQRTPLETGFSLKKAFKGAARSVSSAARTVARAPKAVVQVANQASRLPGVKSVVKVAEKASHLPGVSHALVGYRVAADVAQGRNVVRSVGRQVKTAVADTRKGLPIAAGVVSFVPGVGQGVASGLSAAAALSEGKSLRDIAIDAAIGAVPGGQIAKAATQAGYKIAKGQNVLKSVASSGLDYAASTIGGGDVTKKAIRAGVNVARGQNVIEAVGREVLGSGELATRALRAGANVSRGQNVVKAVGREAVSYAKQAVPVASLVPASARNLAANVQSQVRQAMPLVRPNFGAPVSIAPEHIARTRRLVSDNRPTRARAPLSGHTPKVGFRPLSIVARSALVSAAPRMRSEVSGLSSTGTEWIVESGDTGSKIALKLTGNANRWTELKAVNPKIMARSPDLIKKYGFPIYVGDKVTLPASWIKTTATQTPAQTAPGTATNTSPTSTPATVAPAGDLAAQGQARAILAVWGKADGIAYGTVADYGGASEITATQWTSRDVYQATAFATYWKQKGGVPTVSDGNWSEPLAQALNRYMEMKASQMTGGSGAAAGGQVPGISTTTPSAGGGVTVQTPVGTVDVSPGGISVTPAGGNAPAGSTPTQTQTQPTQTQPTQTQPQATGAAQNASTPTGMSDNQKWAIGSIVGGSLLGAFVRAVT